MPDSSHQETVQFRPRARIMRTLGDDLISDDAVALIELVKNAYDADASHVLVRLTGPLVAPARDKVEHHQSKPGAFPLGSVDSGRAEPKAPIRDGSIDVIDNGHGMDLSTVRTAWMEPATPRKRNSAASAAGRRLTGEKGIGRLAAARLADELLLITRAIGSDTEVRLLVDWSQFDSPDLYLDQVALILESGDPEQIRPGGAIDALWNGKMLPPLHARSHGTLLRMQGLRSEWSRDRIEAIRSRLRRLLSPFDPRFQPTNNDGAGPSGFSISMEVPEPLEDLSGPITPPDMLEYPMYRVFGTVHADGSTDLQYQRRGEPSEPLLRGQTLTVPALGTKGERRLPTAGPFQIELRVWDREISDLEEIARLRGLNDEDRVDSTTIRDIREDLDEISGVSIYRDGFRVLPYGEPDDDWLRLDSRRVQNPRLRVSNNQIVGYISIGADDNPELIDQTNREGLQNTPALQDLKELVLEILTHLEARRRKYRKDRATPDGPPPTDEPTFNPRLPSLFKEINVDGIEAHVDREYPRDLTLQRLVKARQRALREQVSEIQEVLARYRRLSTLGLIVDSVLHDARTPLSLIRGQAELRGRAIRKMLTSDSRGCEELLHNVLEGLERIEKHASVLNAIFQKIEPFGGRKRGRPKKVILEQVIADMFSLRKDDIDDLGVSIHLPEGQTEVTVDSNEMAQVFTNLLDNSLYWLARSDREARAIAVEVERNDEGVEIRFSDSGPGVDPDIRDRLFDPYETLKPDGVGLGLTIVGEIISEYYDGHLQLVRKGPLPGANFRIILRRRV